MCDTPPVVWPDEAIAVIQHHAIQVLILCVETHLNVTSELRVALGPIRLLDLVTQQTSHALHLHLLLPDEDLNTSVTVSCLQCPLLGVVDCRGTVLCLACREEA